MATRRPEPGASQAPPFLRSAAQTYGTSLGSAVLSLVNVLIVARTLGPEGRGHVAFITAAAWLLASVSTLGVQEANANYGAGDRNAFRSLAANSLVFSLLLGTVTFSALWGLISLFPAVAAGSDPLTRWIAFAFLPVLILQVFLRFLAQAEYAFAVTNLAYILPSVLNVVLNGSFAAVGVLGVGTAVGTWLAGQAIATAILCWYVAQRLPGFGRPDLGLARRSLGFGAKAHVGRVMQLGNYRLDQWLLGGIAGPRELGLYSVAVAWAEALWYLPTALASVQRPDLVRVTRQEAARQAARVFRAATALTAFLGLGMVALAPFLCAAIFGEAFQGSVDDLRALTAGAFGMVALKLFGNALVAQGRPVAQSLAIGIGFLFTVLLDALLIPRYGGFGAALASTLAYTAAGAVVATAFLRALEGRAADLVPRPRDASWLARTVAARFRRRTVG